MYIGVILLFYLQHLIVGSVHDHRNLDLRTRFHTPDTPTPGLRRTHWLLSYLKERLGLTVTLEK